MKYINKFGPTRLGLFTQTVVKPVFKARGLMEGKILSHWPQIVGEQLSQVSFAEKITFPKGKRVEGTLHLTVTSSGSLFMQYAQDLILERVNTFFGYKALTKLRFTHGLSLKKESLKPKRIKIISKEDEAWLQKQIEIIKDRDLKTHLETLGKALL
ncbi:MAG: hypothetical protein ACD_16C00099G0022 [uncultured bacterium]|nr:MAG: hypothetical protein ACD_16C00099G0022 [uncultured bacterium]OFW68138.1 MAG: hypothetical protein A2X70_05510 [Alphaproteobacteria bacterium GWC2_42_16]OFW73531.1 MAG: hypothetical protein A2Z80_06810 [Alphaproteobacteria bacterium GWA2_41_27]OFW82380.1 MAG: hypothetical protein A3E50_04210 [Alphaproteobacteria bacterium RIFCSPHIGHO2_12_FULL_42_100]OFW86206.1 MAG: hypothetical protein A2W06_01140 [Alphaproteobacteria bacterium RBG_16_42_14]OFW91764.1 MAG: hypothetical protein A3C41_011